MNESRAARHQRLRRRATRAGALAGMALLALLAFSPLGVALARWAEARSAVWPPAISGAVALVIYVAVVTTVWELAVAIGVAIAAPRARNSERSAGPGLASVVAFAAVVGVPAALFVAIAVRAAVWTADAWWWLVAGAFCAAGLAGVLHAMPALLARWSGARPIERPALLERLGALSRRIRVPIDSIDEVPADSPATSTALVSGAGRARRVFLSSEVVRDWPEEEVAVVVAHEFGHHANHDLWRTLALDSVVLAGGFFLADRLASVVGPPGSLGDLPALPFVSLVVAAVWLAASPLRHASSRDQERRADQFALALTGETAPFRAVIRRLASRHLAEDRPSRMTRWLYHRHPTAAERLALADDFDRRRATSARR